MPELAWIIPVKQGEIDNTLPGEPPQVGVPGFPTPPIQLPPLPPGWVMPPIALPKPPFTPENPIVLPDPPTEGKPPLPPGTIWPPLNPGDGVSGKVLLLVFVVGAGDGHRGGKFKWVVIDTSLTPTPPMAPGGTPTPK